MGKSKAFRVRLGNHSLRVWCHPKGWRFGWWDGEGWRYVTRKDRDEIVEAAEAHLHGLAAGEVVFEALDRPSRAFLARVAKLAPDEESRQAVVGFLEARARSEDLKRAAKRFMAGKDRQAGERTPHLATMASRFRHLGQAFGNRRVSEVTFEEIQEWVASRTAGKSVKVYIDLRANLIEFWRWCRREGLISAAEVPVAERLPAAKRDKGQRRVATPAELARCLNEVAVEWRAWVVLGAWAGLRPEEIAPKQYTKKRDKRGLRCEEIDWRFGVLRLGPEVVKAGGPRVVPMCDALRAGLAWAGIEPGMSGPVCLRNPTEQKETGRLAELVFGGAWPKDVFRHSYASNRNALIRSLGQVAEEMGTSERMLADHYHNPRAEAEGRAWFESVIPISSDGVTRWVAVDADSATGKPSKSGKGAA